MSQPDLSVIPENLKTIASQCRRFIIRCVLELPEAPAVIAEEITRTAKKRSLIAADKKGLDANTLRTWASTQSSDGKNVANAWACTAAMHLLVERGQRMTFPHANAYWAAVYYVSPTDDLSVIRHSQSTLANLFSIRENAAS